MTSEAGGADPSLAALVARVPEGWTAALYKGRTYGLYRTTRTNGRSVAVLARELGGQDEVSANVYLTSEGPHLRSCEMPDAKVLHFLANWKRVPAGHRQLRRQAKEPSAPRHEESSSPRGPTLRRELEHKDGRSSDVANMRPAPPQPGGMNCSDVTTYGSLALDGSLLPQATVAISQHLSSCSDCARHVDQMAKTKALLGGRSQGSGGDTSTGKTGLDDIGQRINGSAVTEPEQVLARQHAYLTSLARAADPLHADDLVQDTWDHFLRDDPTHIPSNDQLTAFLTAATQAHAEADRATAEAWADALTGHHPHNPSDLAETDLPADPSQHEDWRILADLDLLDADADGAELYFPELYGDGPDTGEWAAQPAAWPSITRLLSPEDELQTSELHAVLDAALNELPTPAADAIYLVDIEGQSLTTAVGHLGRDLVGVQRDLVRARHHVRNRISAYLMSR